MFKFDLLRLIGWIIAELGRRWEGLEKAWQILVNYAQLGEE